MRNNIKSAASRDTTAKPHRIVTDSFNNVSQDVNNHLQEPPSLKRTIQREREIDTLTANPDLTLACDRSLLMLHIPQTLLRSWKYFDSNLDLLCQSQAVDPTQHPSRTENGYTVPWIYALLPNKRKETYIRLFRQVKSWVDVGNWQWIFETFLSDYEQGAFNVILEVFPGIVKFRKDASSISANHSTFK